MTSKKLNAVVSAHGILVSERNQIKAGRTLHVSHLLGNSIPLRQTTASQTLNFISHKRIK